MTMIKTAVVSMSFFLVLAMGGCGQRKEMRDKFDGGNVLIVTDERGNRYAIIHHMDDLYLVKDAH